ncbi:OsmC/Ohr family [Mucidula mucida]|nr:OsmC/Ohr family [Mucidula mucida]
MSMSFLNTARLSTRTLGRGLALRTTSRVPVRSFMSLKTSKYDVTATAQGSPRDGSTSCNGLTLNLAPPKEMGGAGNGENPEQLFAMGYSACLLEAIHLVARQMNKTDMAQHAKVHVTVHLGEPNDLPGFGIGVNVKVEGIDDELLQAGHEACPYNRMLKYGVDVQATVA